MGTPLQEILMGGRSDQRMAATYAQLYPFLAPHVDSPQSLMSFIDSVNKRENANSPGTAAELWTAQKAKAALNDIYGINDYTPKGFMQWNEEQKNWIDPRQQ